MALITTGLGKRDQRLVMSVFRKLSAWHIVTGVKVNGSPAVLKGAGGDF